MTNNLLLLKAYCVLSTDIVCPIPEQGSKTVVRHGAVLERESESHLFRVLRQTSTESLPLPLSVLVQLSVASNYTNHNCDASH